MLTNNNSKFIKQTANTLGFDYCGIAKATFLNEDAKRLEDWLQKGFNGSMQYMQNYFDLRTDPQKLVPNAKSVITLLKNYYPEQLQISNEELGIRNWEQPNKHHPTPNTKQFSNEKEQARNELIPKISKYAYGKDYHEVIRQQLHQFYDDIKKQIGDFNGRGFVDSAPVLERAWAVKSGLGWVGKNGNLINKNSGSFFFIATLIIDVELDYDNPYIKDYCGTCTKCIDSCPTEAILPNKVVDGSKCISYFTIELKDALIPDNMKGKFDNWMFGCDVCQDVCPWNRFAKPHNELQFTPIPEILDFTTSQWNEMTEEQFKIIFKNSPLNRTKFSGIKRNLKFINS
ncbi:MAG: tRNA epoxyqueuosine(34) reductase QueG [Chitinophagaceae bacterium]